MNNGNGDSRLLSPREAARALDTSVSTLARWRQEGKGPRYFKLGDGQFSRVKYRVSDVRAFLEAGAVERGCSGAVVPTVDGAAARGGNGVDNET